MLPGRPNEGTKIKQLRGTLRKDRHGDGAIAFTPVTKVTTPKHLSKSAKKEWKTVTTELIQAGLLQMIDLTALAAYCQEMGEYWDLLDDIMTNGRTFETEKGYIGQRPEVSMAGKALERAMKIGLRFGITPVAREKIRIRDSGKGHKDPMEGLI